MWKQIAQHISEVTSAAFAIEQRRSVSGGSINQAYAISDGDRTYFLKLNQASKSEMFSAEAEGLKEMAATKTIKVPLPICLGVADDSSYLVLEWMQFAKGNTGNSSLEMGRQLAAMHKVNTSTQFGWHRNNTIGSTLQLNPWTDSWADFFAESRIGYQLRLAKRRGGNFFNQEDILAAVREILAPRQPQPSLVHGDLWSGNSAVLVSGEPVILDPATHYGDREVDIAMTELFGGFPAGFYRGYNEVWPLDEGYQQRKTLYNLYHVLNHFNLFGGGYESQAARMIQQILS